MKYIEETATPGETIYGTANFSWLFLLAGMIPFFLLLGVLFVGVEFAGEYLHLSFIPPRIFTLILLLLVVVGVIRYLSSALPWMYTEIAVTNRRVVYSHGLISRQAEEVAINRIEGVNLQQSLMGRMLGFGTLQVYGIGVDSIVLPPIAQPLEFRKAIQSAINDSQSRDATFN